MDPVASPEGASAADWALHQIIELIYAGSLGPGDRLLAERELAGRLGVSRASVREALRALVALGILESRHGAGVFVTSLEPTTLLPALTQVLAIVHAAHPDEMGRMHALVEAAAAARAAARATDESIAPLTQALNELRIAIQEPVSGRPADQFRDVIIRLSDERFHRAIATIAEDPVAEGMILLLRGARDRRHAPAEHDLGLHADLVRAIAAREPDTARNIAETLARQERAHRTAASSPEQPSGHPPALGARPDVARDGEPREAGDSEGVPMPEWFLDAKFGVIVHWGLYTIPGWAPLPEDPRDSTHPWREAELPYEHFAEWYRLSSALPGSATARYHSTVYGDRDYSAFQPAFEQALDSWDPDTWAELFQQAGVQYVVQVAKHHDGYLLWPSEIRHPLHQRWHATRDVLAAVSESVTRRGIRFGISYSSGVDWSFSPESPTTASDIQTSSPPGSDYARYVEDHWRELISRYRPCGLWNDTGYPSEGDAQQLFRDYHAVVPDGVVTSRFRTSAVGSLPTEPATSEFWESVRPLGQSFGWNRQETARHVISGGDLVVLLIDVVARGGNLLLGVTPDDRGVIPDAQQESLRHLGTWLDAFGECVMGTRPWRWTAHRTDRDARVWYTCTPESLYLVTEDEREDFEVHDLQLPSGTTVTDLSTGNEASHDSAVHGVRIRTAGSPSFGRLRVLRIQPVPRP